MIRPTVVNPKRIGILTPSPNTVLEPCTARLFMPFVDTVTVHFSRFDVTDVSLSQSVVRQFDHEAIVDAAHRLAEAKVDCIAWSDTSAAWLGMEQDQALCKRIAEETGIPTISTMEAFAQAIERLQAKRLALVTPYTSEIQGAILDRCREQGFEVVHDIRLEDSEYFSFANYSVDEIKGHVMKAAECRPDVILIICTNFRGATVAAEVETSMDVPVLDSVSVTAWYALQQVGVDPGEIAGWGRVFAL